MFDNIKFERISLGTDILDGSRTNCLLHDSQGFLWIGNDRALARYDGNGFKSYVFDKLNSNGIPGRKIVSISEDVPGRLLALSIEPKLFEFRLDEEVFNVINVPFFRPGAEMVGIVKDSKDFIWLGTFLEGLFRFNSQSNEFENFRCENFMKGETVNDNFISCMYYEKDKESLYIGTRSGGVNVYDFNTGRFAYILDPNSGDNRHECKRVRKIFRDSKKNLWFGTIEGLYRYNEYDSLIKKFVNDPERNDTISNDLIYDICEDKNGFLWIGTEMGLNCMNPDDEVFTRFIYDKNNSDGIHYNIITAITCDNGNNIFYGTYGGGIGKFNSDPGKIYNLKIKPTDPNNVLANHISQIYKDDLNNLWVGTYKGGFYKCIPNENNNYTFLEFKELEGVQITGITGDSNSNIWVTSNKKSLCRINIRDNSVMFVDEKVFSEFTKTPFRYIFCQCRDRLNENYLWLSVNWEYLVLFDTKNLKIIDTHVINNVLRDVSIYSLYSDSDGNLWIGTFSKGLYKYDANAKEIINYNYLKDNKGSLPDTDVNSIAEDAYKNIYVGTVSGGFCRLSKGEDFFKRFSTVEGFPGNTVNGLFTDDNGYLWVGVKEALVRLNTSDDSFISLTESGNIDLKGFNTFACHKAHDGVIYLGTVFGIFYFKPKEITTNSCIPNIVLTDFQIFYESVKPSPENPFLKKSISYAKEITLTHKESVITFEFAALIYNNPKKNEYAYKMEGFDEDWVYCGTRRTATYTNLDPGEYTFRVKGSNNDGLWNEEGTSIKVIITPPWYKTVLFKGLVGLSVIGSIGSFYRNRIQKLNKEKTQQEEFTKKLIESQENERKRVAAELHDSLGQDLLIIKNKALVSIKKTNDLEKFKKEMNEISDLTSATLNDVREISYNLRPYELDRLGLTKTIESMIERANNSTNINFVADIDNIDKVFIPEIEINIYRIIQESLNNIIKHSEAKEVTVVVNRTGKEIHIEISDDGKGFDIRKYKMNSKRNGFGLKGIEERVKLMNGEFNIESKEGKGTVVEIQLTVNS